jgi:hypothetical protein
MNKVLLPILFLMSSTMAMGQSTGKVDKKTKEFFIVTNPKAEYRIFGYQFPNNTTKKMICFSTYSYDVRDNLNKCPLGSYFDTGSMKEGDKIVYLGLVGSFAKMNYISGSGKKTLFYMPKTSFVIK